MPSDISSIIRERKRERPSDKREEFIARCNRLHVTLFIAASVIPDFFIPLFRYLSECFLMMLDYANVD